MMSLSAPFWSATAVPPPSIVPVAVFVMVLVKPPASAEVKAIAESESPLILAVHQGDRMIGVESSGRLRPRVPWTAITHNAAAAIKAAPASVH